MRKDGRVIGQYEIETPERKKTKYVSGKTKREVARKLAKAIADSEAGLICDAEKLTLADYLDKWIDSVKDTVRPGTWRRHEPD